MTSTRVTARAIRRRIARADGVTLTEMLAVLAILGIIVGGMTTLFVSASTSQVDQSNRYQAQHNARLALDALRREIRCASSVTAITPASLTVSLPGYCQKPVAASAATFTWCAVGAAAPYALWRYTGNLCSGTGRRTAESLSLNQVFTYDRGSIVSPPTLTPSTTGGTLGPGTYAYDVTAVNAAGTEISGTINRIVIATGATNSVTISWSGYTGAVSYNIYGRDDGTRTTEGLRLLTNTASTSHVDTGAAITSTVSPPLGTVSVTLALDLTPVDGKQRFTLADDIVLRNSGRG